MTSIRFLVGCLSLLLIATPLNAAVIVVNPTRDTSIFSESNNSAGGTTSTPVTAGKTSIYSGNNGNGQPRRALLAFDQIASQIPAGATIDGASLTLWLNQVSNTETLSRSYALHRITGSALTGDWGEGSSFGTMGDGGMGGVSATGDATWNARRLSQQTWGTPGGDYVAAASAATIVGFVDTVAPIDNNYTWNSLGLAADVQAWLDNPSTNFGWILIGDESVTNTSRRFGSSEDPSASVQPRLTITYTLAAVPEPATWVWLLVGAAVSLWGIRLVRA